MRKKLISFMILTLALSLLTLGIIQNQVTLINSFYEQMSIIP
ncbi:MAG: hypothetical protein ACTSUT_01700 [Promethearchaeota archaeon]